MSTRLLTLSAIGFVSFCGIAYCVPELPAAEQAIQDNVDHWGQAFSDQFRLFELRFEEFAEECGAEHLDYVLGVESSLRKTFPNKYWFKGRITRVAELFAARNEAEAFQLAILPKTGFALSDVVVAASDLTKKDENGGTDTIRASAVRLWRVGFVNTRQPQYPTRHVGLWPDPLLELEPFSVTGVDLGLVWCEIKAPKTAAPGDYTGTITVSASNAPDLELTLNLHVWDFALPDRPAMPMLVWTREKSGDEFLELAALLLEHHVDPIKTGQNSNFEELDKNLAFCFERGLTYFQTIPFKDAETFRPYYEHIKEKGWLDKALVYGAHDEPLKEQFEEICIPQTQRLRQAFPGLRVFLASEYHDGMDRGADIHLVDMSTNFHSWLDAGRPGSQELWWYFCGIPIRAELRRCLMDAPRMLIDRDAIEHRIVYWMAHHYKVKGLFTYAGDIWPKGNDNWPQEAFKGNETLRYPYAGLHNGDGFIVYPGPRPSIRLKNIRDGAEDYAYLRKLEELARSAEHGEQAQALLDSITPAVFMDTHCFSRRPESMLAYRRKIGEFIEMASGK